MEVGSSVSLSGFAFLPETGTRKSWGLQANFIVGRARFLVGG